MNGGVLLDRHIFVWARLRPQRLSAGESRTLDDALVRYVSVVNLWEIAILQSLRRLETDPELLQVPDEFDLLPVLPAHCSLCAGLPMHHRDPFDRMLVAQACSERVPLLSRDKRIEAYGAEAAILRFPEA